MPALQEYAIATELDQPFTSDGKFPAGNSPVGFSSNHNEDYSAISSQFVQVNNNPMESLLLHETVVGTSISVTNVTQTNPTVSSTMSQLSELKLVSMEELASGNILQTLQFDGTSVPLVTPTEGTVENIQVPAVNLITNPTTSNVYVVAMTVDDVIPGAESTEKQEVEKQQVSPVVPVTVEKTKTLEEPQRTSTPLLEDGSAAMNETILAGNLNQQEGTVEINGKDDKDVHKEPEKDRVESEGLIEKEILMKIDNKIQPQHVNISTQKKSVTVEKENKKEENSDGGVRKTKMDSKLHNKSYCKEWVSTMESTKTLAQNATFVEQDSCDSNLLLNTTSVSRNIVKKKPFQKPMSQVKRTAETSYMSETKM